MLKKKHFYEFFRNFRSEDLLALCVITAKILLQKLWVEKVAWDETVPMPIITFWREFLSKLATSPFLSKNAFGACVYIRSTNARCEIFSNLFYAKSKGSSLKTITLPRLELRFALILARLNTSERFFRHTFWSLLFLSLRLCEISYKSLNNIR